MANVILALLVVAAIVALGLIGMMWGWGMEPKNWGWIAFSYLGLMFPVFINHLKR
jgi:hypothetical protein